MCLGEKDLGGDEGDENMTKTYCIKLTLSSIKNIKLKKYINVQISVFCNKLVSLLFVLEKDIILFLTTACQVCEIAQVKSGEGLCSCLTNSMNKSNHSMEN